MGLRNVGWLFCVVVDLGCFGGGVLFVFCCHLTGCAIFPTKMWRSRLTRWTDAGEFEEVRGWGCYMDCVVVFFYWVF